MAKSPKTTTTADGESAKPAMDPAVLKQVAEVRDRLQQAFGRVAMAMMVLPRYRNLPISDLHTIVLAPLMRDRLVMASTQPKESETPGEIAGIILWASVSEAVDARIREQIKTGVFPVRLQPEDWNSGAINWLLDIIAPDVKHATSVLANFKQVVKQGDVNIHPMAARQVNPDILKKMGVTSAKVAEPAAAKN